MTLGEPAGIGPDLGVLLSQKKLSKKVSQKKKEKKKREEGKKEGTKRRHLYV